MMAESIWEGNFYVQYYLLLMADVSGQPVTELVATRTSSSHMTKRSYIQRQKADCTTEVGLVPALLASPYLSYLS